ncbi:uncharacterized protein LOC124552587 [Schistocerca americana]|nr:uncharacterized protein LOC124552587 [Schistocerca americana]
MSSLVVYVVVFIAACAAAQSASKIVPGPAVSGTVDCYDENGKLRHPRPTSNLLDCKPWCPPGCPEGGCFRHNRCNCGTGYKDARTRDEMKAKAPVRCEPVCRYGCVNGDCVAPETCECWEGYMKDPLRINTCVWGD